MRMLFAGLSTAEIDDMEYVEWRRYRQLTDVEMSRRGLSGGG